MGMIRGRVSFGDGGRGLAALGMAQHIQIGVTPWRYCAEHDKYYDKETGEEMKVVKMSLAEFLEPCRLPCCVPAAPPSGGGE